MTCMSNASCAKVLVKLTSVAIEVPQRRQEFENEVVYGWPRDMNDLLMRDIWEEEEGVEVP